MSQVYVSDPVRDVERLHADLFGPDFTRLPVRDQLDRQAHRLLEGHRRGDPAVAVHVHCWHPALIGASPEQVLAYSLTLDDARQTMAREYGFPDWAAAEAKGALPPDADFEAAVDAVVMGDLNRLRELLQRRPELIHDRSAYGHRSTLLHYVGSNGVETHRQKVPANLAAVAQLLLDAGAEVNATADMYGGNCTTLALLLTSGHPDEAGVTDEAAKVLRDAGALTDVTIHGAVKDGDLPRVRALLDADPRLGQDRDGDGWTPLHHAASHGHTEVAAFLIERGADVNARDAGDQATPLCWAASKGYLDVVRLLVGLGSPVDNRDDVHALGPLGWATVHGPHRAVAEFLIQHGARHTIFTAVALGEIDEVKRLAAQDPASVNSRLTKHDEEKTPLDIAATRDQPDMVRLLLERGAERGDPNVDGLSPFFFAVRLGKNDGVAALLLADGPPSDLYFALAQGDAEAIDRICRSSPGLVSPGGKCRWALHVVATKNWPHMIDVLVAHGANPNAVWQASWAITPLHYAAHGGHRQLCEALLRYGAAATNVDGKYGATPAQWALHGGHRELARFLAEKE